MGDLAWTAEAEQLVARVPFFVRPIIRRRVEAAARQSGRTIINAEFVAQLRDRQMGPPGAPQAAASPASEDARVAEARADIAFLAHLVEIYCHAHHAEAPCQPVAAQGRLGEFWPAEAPKCCAACGRLLLHAAAKRLVCPHYPKPSCRNCTTPCQRADYREALGEVMRWGMGRADAQPPSS
jgi:hypothetical protein